MAGLTVRAAVVERAGAVPVVEEIELAAVGPSDVLLSVRATGVCHTDIAWADGAFGGTFPGVAGHEIAGVVRATGTAVGTVAVGDHVVACVVSSCGACARCRGGEPALCERRDGQPVRMSRSGRPITQAFGTGGFAEQTVLDASAVVPIPKYLPFETAAVLGCAALTGYGAATRIAARVEGLRVAVLGCGAVGVAVSACARAAGASHVVAVDPDRNRRTLALGLGADRAIDPAALVDEQPFDVVFEAAGTTSAATAAIRAARRGGEIILIGLPAAGVSLELDQLAFVVDQKRLVGCNMGNAVPVDDVPAILALHDRGLLDLGAFVTDVLPLSRIDAAFRAARSHHGLRTVVVPD
jgi:Zn-dependent alcohol dehydrogenase